MTRPTRAGIALLLAAPVLVFAGVALLPTVSDDTGTRLTALTSHRGAMIAGMTLQTLAIASLIGGVIWLAHALVDRAPRFAVVGGALAVVGSLVPLFEDGVGATLPSIAASLDPAQATVAMQRIHASLAVSALEPLSLVGDLGIALLGIGVLRAGAPRRVAVAMTLGAFGEGIGFGSATRPLILAAFVVLFVGFAGAVRSVAGAPVRRFARQAVEA